MCSVGGTECVAYIVVCEVSQLFAELFAVLCLLSSAETGVLKKNDISLFHCVYSLCCSFAGYVVIGYENNFFSEFLRKALCNRSQGFSLVRAIFYFSKVGAKNHFAAIVDQLLDCRESCVDTCLVCDLTVL